MNKRKHWTKIPWMVLQLPVVVVGFICALLVDLFTVCSDWISDIDYYIEANIADLDNVIMVLLG